MYSDFISLFRPSIFESIQPQYRILPAKYSQQYFKLLLNYPKLFSLPFELWELDALEVNSRNYKITQGCDAISLSLKQLNENSDLDSLRIRHQFLLSYAVSSSLFPLIYTDIYGSTISHCISKSGCVISRFVEGRYYNTISQTEADSLCVAIKKLSMTDISRPELSNFPRCNQHKQLDEIISTFEYFYSIKYDKIRTVGLNEYNLLQAMRSDLFSILNLISRLDFPEDIILSHFDLHPLNILIDNKSSKIWLVDIDSLFLGPSYIALAYAAFRLQRALYILSSTYIPGKFLISLKAAFGPYCASLHNDTIMLYAKYELLRRISLVLILNYKYHNSKWNKILESLIAGIYECDYL